MILVYCYSLLVTSIQNCLLRYSTELLIQSPSLPHRDFSILIQLKRCFIDLIDSNTKEPSPVAKEDKARPETSDIISIEIQDIEYHLLNKNGHNYSIDKSDNGKAIMPNKVR